MNRRTTQIDLVKLALYILKRCWLLVICAAVGFGFMYWRTSRRPVTYTASGTMYVYNANPNMVNYGYTNTSDLASALKLIDTYTVVVKSNKVMDRVLESQVEKTAEDGTVTRLMLFEKYPGLTTGYMAGTLSMSSVSDTGVLRVRCTTNDPEKSADICNAVLMVAPQAIIDVVGAGQAEMIDAALVPRAADARPMMRQGMTGALAGAAVAAAFLALLFLLNQKIEDPKELTDTFTIPVLAAVKRNREESTDPGKFLLTDRSEMDQIESYAKLRMNLLYTLVGKDRHAVAVTSAISGEGKSTITANLAISVAMSGKRVLLVDADMRRACQHEVFHYDDKLPGLSDVLVGGIRWEDAILKGKPETLDILPAGTIPPNPAELLDSDAMHALLEELGAAYDLILLDAPPINIVSDPLALSSMVAGGLFVVRQSFSDRREVQKAVHQAEMTGLDLLGFVFYGENLRQGSYYSRKYYKGYKNYYHTYDTRNRYEAQRQTIQASQGNQGEHDETSRRTNSDEQAQISSDASAPSSDGDAGVRHRRSGRA